MSTAPSSKFARYSAASAAALGAAAAAQAQFTGDFSLTSPSPAAGTYNNVTDASTFGTWTAYVLNRNAGGTNVVDTTNAGSGFLNLQNFDDADPVSQILTFISAPVATDTQVSFHYSSNNTVNGTGVASFYYSDNYGINSYTALNGGSGYVGGNATFLVTAGNQFGFRLVGSAVYSSLSGSGTYVTISSFNATAAIPEPGTSGLVMACVTAGFVGLMGVREMRRRAAAKSAA